MGIRKLELNSAKNFFGLETLFPTGRSTIVDDFLRGDFGQDWAAEQCMNQIRKGDKNSRNLISNYFSKRFDINFPEAYLDVCAQGLWTPVIRNIQTVLLETESLTLTVGRKKVVMGTVSNPENGDIYVLITLDQFEKKSWLSSGMKPEPISGELQLVYKLSQSGEQPAAEPVGYKATAQVATELAVLQRLSLSAEEKPLDQTDKTLKLDLIIKDNPPKKPGLFERIGNFFSGIRNWFQPRQSSVVAQSTAEDLKPKTSSRSIYTQPSMQKTTEIVVQPTRKSEAKKTTRKASIFNWFRRKPIEGAPVIQKGVQTQHPKGPHDSDSLKKP
jgi:hypothetical protein